MTYEQILERTPKSTTAGDKRSAKVFVDFLTGVFADEGLVVSLTSANRNYLYKLRAKWQLRADGLDHRWNTCGSSPGRPRVEKSKPDRVSRRNEDSTDGFDDLSKRIIERYRKIRPESGEV